MNKIAKLISNIITKDWIASLTNLAMDKSSYKWVLYQYITTKSKISEDTG